MHCDRQTAALVRRAGSLAREMGHSFVGSVHLLLALSEAAGGPGQLLRGLGLESESARALVSLHYRLGDGALPLPQGYTRAARRLLRSAAREARHLGRRRIVPRMCCWPPPGSGTARLRSCFRITDWARTRS